MPPLFGRARRTPKDELGEKGEKQAAKFLTRKGLRLIARNYSCKYGEIDLIMADPAGAIVFIEVKTRTSEDIAEAQQAVAPAKQRRIKRTARLFISEYDLNDRGVRFDVAAVIFENSQNPEIRHYPGAFR